MTVGGEMEAGAIERCGENMPLAGLEAGGGGELVVFAEPEDDFSGIEAKVARVFGGRAAEPGDERKGVDWVGGFDPAEERPGRVGEQYGIARVRMGLARPGPSARKVALYGPNCGASVAKTTAAGWAEAVAIKTASAAAAERAKLRGFNMQERVARMGADWGD